jgi:hypothetical protein
MNNSKDQIYCSFVVAFIDVLGQREEFAAITEDTLNNDEETKQKISRLHENTTEYLEFLREGFQGFFDKFLKEKPPSVKIPTDKIELFKEMNKSNLKYKYFSDSIQIFVPLMKNKYCSNTVNGVYAVMTACGAMLLASLARKKAFRAGIDVGVGTQIDENEMYGPGLFSAYDLESKIAGYPRIVVGDNLLRYLNVHAQGRKMYDEQEDIDVGWCKIISQLCLNIIGTDDVDGYAILHYLGDTFLIDTCVSNVL